MTGAVLMLLLGPGASAADPACLEGADLSGKAKGARRIGDARLRERLSDGWRPERIVPKGYWRQRRVDFSKPFVADGVLLDQAQVEAVLATHPGARSWVNNYRNLQSRAHQIDMVDNRKRLLIPRTIGVGPDTIYLPRVITDEQLESEEAVRQSMLHLARALCAFNRDEQPELVVRDDASADDDAPADLLPTAAQLVAVPDLENRLAWLRKRMDAGLLPEVDRRRAMAAIDVLLLLEEGPDLDDEVLEALLDNALSTDAELRERALERAERLKTLGD